MTLDDFLQTIVADPLSAATTWLVLADWLEDKADPRFELVRLLHQSDYRQELTPPQRDARVRALLASGVQPVVPCIENSIGMRFALIPAGTFLMGSPDGGLLGNERPQHQVELTRSFYMGAFQVTQQEYQQVMGKKPSWFCATGAGKGKILTKTGWFSWSPGDTSRFPVETVSWKGAVAFCELLSSLPEEKKAGRTYRLPTEAMWEYSCRGGATSHCAFHFGDSLSSTQANFTHGNGKEAPSLERPCPVGSFAANAFGLFDMHGNVWEWCEDWYDASYYNNSSKSDPQGPQKGERRVLRGGSWYNFADYCRSAYRYWDAHGDPYNDYGYGFRVCFLLDL